MGRSSGYYAMWNKEIPHNLIYLWNLKKKLKNKAETEFARGRGNWEIMQNVWSIKRLRDITSSYKITKSDRKQSQ